MGTSARAQGAIGGTRMRLLFSAVYVREQRERVADPHAHPGARAGNVDDLESICLRRDRRGSRCVVTVEWTGARASAAGRPSSGSDPAAARIGAALAHDPTLASPVSGGPGTQSNGLAHSRLAYGGGARTLCTASPRHLATDDPPTPRVRVGTQAAQRTCAAGCIITTQLKKQHAQ